MVEVDEEIKKDLEVGVEIDEEELFKRIYKKMNFVGVCVKQLKRNIKQVGEINRRVKMMFKFWIFLEMRDFLVEGVYKFDFNIDFYKGVSEEFDIDESKIIFE